MEDEVPGLFQVAALCRDTEARGAPTVGVVPLGAVTTAAQLLLGESHSVGRIGCGVGIRPFDQRLAIRREPLETCRSARGPGPQRLPVVLRARDDTSDERDEQQDVDRREPGRRVDVEQLEPVEDRREVGVVGEVLRHAVGIGTALGYERPRDRRDCEQQKQEQRRAHAGELAPSPPRPSDDAERGRVDGVGGGRTTGIRAVGRSIGVIGGAKRIDGHVIRAGGGH